jgi:hypothetical protein
MDNARIVIDKIYSYDKEDIYIYIYVDKHDMGYLFTYTSAIK